MDRGLLVKKLSKEIMRVADRFSANQDLSVSEIKTFLKGSPHEDFLEFILGMDVHGKLRFSHYDTDGEGSLDLDELSNAVTDYLLDRMGEETFER